MIELTLILLMFPFGVLPSRLAGLEKDPGVEKCVTPCLFLFLSEVNE
jgi:hypothetical protein